MDTAKSHVRGARTGQSSEHSRTNVSGKIRKQRARGTAADHVRDITRQNQPGDSGGLSWATSTLRSSGSIGSERRHGVVKARTWCWCCMALQQRGRPPGRAARGGGQRAPPSTESRGGTACTAGPGRTHAGPAERRPRRLPRGDAGLYTPRTSRYHAGGQTNARRDPSRTPAPCVAKERVARGASDENARVVHSPYASVARKNNATRWI
ncbi:hypothetical protein HPB50_023257 [Hyalomma asiaticum]|uniref:Uncharacterized protein n=1 Tax=Hyalomma asiaticum TaxID=266040 RepID=A0ACB7S8H9_HYAAI|nr:hypothetical protein HPB50_023257 [Hyalomma asiaticum]